LGPWEERLAEQVRTLGYAPTVARRQMEWVRRLSGFLDERGLAASELNADVVEEFFAVVRDKRRSTRPTAKTLAWLLPWLLDLGVTTGAVVAPPPRSADEELVGRYERYLRDERGLAPDTVSLYSPAAALLLRERAGRGLEGLVAEDVAKFMTRECRQRSPRSAERLATGLRSFLRFALLEGLITAPLASAVPSTARWSGAGLPHALTAAEVAVLLASCDRRRPKGRRDYAILKLLARLGLRAAEVAALRLEDIDWRAGEIVVRGKGRTEERLPLPCDVGEALAAYLRRGRPRRPEREVFLRVLAPVHGLEPQGVSEVVRAAAERAGIGSFGSHRLRHTAGTQMLRAGASLADVAQVLRHRSVTTTAIYAKVDHLALEALVLPWPRAQR
jgi:site-specific recombinase XerD